jgi:hypothetical protein
VIQKHSEFSRNRVLNLRWQKGVNTDILWTTEMKWELQHFFKIIQSVEKPVTLLEAPFLLGKYKCPQLAHL